MKYCYTVFTFVIALSCIATLANMLMLQTIRDVISRKKSVFLPNFQINNILTDKIAILKSSVNSSIEKKFSKMKEITSSLMQNSSKAEFMSKMEKRMKDRTNYLEERCKELGKYWPKSYGVFT